MHSIVLNIKIIQFIPIWLQKTIIAKMVFLLLKALIFQELNQSMDV
ncbi:hypothetical protein HMPREF1616_03420 [Escherichia coli 908658]|nr:hypothetical protein HMPREF1616_03420 [Escherichia coli 908658]